MLKTLFKVLMLVFFSIFVFAGVAKAQVVNVQSTLSGYIKPGMTLQMDITQSQLRGNIDSDNLYVNSTNTIRTRNHLLLMIFKRDFGTFEGERSSDSVFGHARYGYYFTKRWSMELFGQMDEDEFKRNAGRTIYGTGLRYQINTKSNLTFTTSAGYLVETEKFTPFEEFSDTDDGVSTFYIDKDREAARWIAAAHLSYFFNDTSGFNLTAESTPAVEEIDNYKALYEASLFFDYSENISFSITYQHSHNSLPPYGVQKIDTSLDNSLTLNYHKSFGKSRKSRKDASE